MELLQVIFISKMTQTNHSDSTARSEIVGDVLAVAATGGMTIDSGRGAGERNELPPGRSMGHRDGRAMSRAISKANAASKTPRTDA
jgi:hypothetical protein